MSVLRTSEGIRDLGMPLEVRDVAPADDGERSADAYRCDSGAVRAIVAGVANIPGEGVNAYQRTGRRNDPAA
jgi:hypothetical protein